MAEYFFGITDKGKRRDTNEDTFIVREVSNGQFLLACVIDGVGGYNGGEVAAEIARMVIFDELQNVEGDIVETLQHAVIAANEKIHAERSGSESNASMACVLTCAIVDIKNNKLYYSHVGDTRLYLLRDASLVKISKDHSAVGFLEESGRLSEDDAMRHPRRNEINKALGFETGIAEVADYIETGESPFLPGDTILLCSDGLSDMIGSGAITSILNKSKSLAGKARDLINAANEAGGNDNITAVLVENIKQPKKQVALKPAEKRNGNGVSHSSGENPATQKLPVTAKSSNRGMVIFLSLLCLGLLTALGVSLFQQRTVVKNNVPVPASRPATEKDAQLLSMITAVNDSGRSYSLQPGSTFSMAEAIRLSKDSFYLRGNGAHIVCDSNYKGPAFIVSKDAKQIMIDSLVFENFDAALLIQKSNIILRNVRFINCKNPVLYAAAVPDSTISGRFKDSIFITTQSLKKR
jgi:PPM family protein phosphatase